MSDHQHTWEPQLEAGMGVYRCGCGKWGRRDVVTGRMAVHLRQPPQVPHSAATAVDLPREAVANEDGTGARYGGTRTRPLFEAEDDAQ